MGVMDFFVITELDVYNAQLYAMVVHHAVMDLMKQIVVRFINILTTKEITLKSVFNHLTYKLF